jgi:hypothetical protein
MSLAADQVRPDDSTRRLVRACGDAGGPATLRSLDEFSMHLAIRVNFILMQAELALDRSAS